tara:strand:- start:987 stop:1763 length:777 start_codon:yes stop_codon:yes gene_type:complete
MAEGGTTLAQRALLAAQAFSHTATYDIAVATWMSTTLSPDESEFPRWRGTAWTRSEVLRYGENPHQSAASYIGIGHESGVANAQQLQGKPMSYNNFIDSDAARRAAFDFSEPAVAIIKHANPCGIAVGLDIEQAYRKAHFTDPVSAFGGVVAANRRVTKKMAESLLEVFTEVIIAPEFDADALNLLKEKANLRILVAQDRSLAVALMRAQSQVVSSFKASTLCTKAATTQLAGTWSVESQHLLQVCVIWNLPGVPAAR